MFSGLGVFVGKVRILFFWRELGSSMTQPLYVTDSLV